MLEPPDLYNSTADDRSTPGGSSYTISELDQFDGSSIMTIHHAHGGDYSYVTGGTRSGGFDSAIVGVGGGGHHYQGGGGIFLVTKDGIDGDGMGSSSSFQLFRNVDKGCCKPKRQRRCLFFYELVVWALGIIMLTSALHNANRSLSFIEGFTFTLWLVCSIGILNTFLFSFRRNLKSMLAYGCFSLPRPIAFLIILFYEFEETRRAELDLDYLLLVMALTVASHFFISVCTIVTSLQGDLRNPADFPNDDGDTDDSGRFITSPPPLDPVPTPGGANNRNRQQNQHQYYGSIVSSSSTSKSTTRVHHQQQETDRRQNGMTTSINNSTTTADNNDNTNQKNATHIFRDPSFCEHL